MPQSKRPWIKYLLIAAAVAALYFINVEVQTRLGEKALAATGLETYSLDEAFAKARAENKLVLADLSAIWCPTCRNLDKQVFSDETVKEAIRRNYVFARIEFESDEGEAFQQRYDTRSFPSLLVLSPSGELVRELPVTTEPAAFISAL